MECYEIPERVMFDNMLPAGAKFLYGIIAADAAGETVVTVSDESLAKLFKASKKTVAKWIKALTAAGYISAEAVLVSNANELALNGWEIQVRKHSLVLPEAD